MTEGNGERERFAENHEWFEAHLSDLLERYRGRFVAIDRGAVLGDAAEVQDLARRYGKDPGILIEKVVRPGDEILFVF
jgi:chromosome condensin MukBEF complex kleisin-like MukF subunit